MQPQPVLRDEFYHDGRGPELVRVHYDPSGSRIRAVDFYNPDESKRKLKHLYFVDAQAFQFTPEEEHAYSRGEEDWSKTGNASIVNLGKSEWYKSFSNLHSINATHFRIMFYDEILDIVCERIEVRGGSYAQEGV